MTTHKVLSLAALLVFAATSVAVPPPSSITELADEDRNVALTFEQPGKGGPGFSAELWSYPSAGLKIFALVARPIGAPPESGWPVLVANHGHHPDPPRYGVTAAGIDHRPGDYYRKIPELFVARGYLVVMTDYRGHSQSQGLEFTEGLLESAYYTEDVLNLLEGLDDIPAANTDQLFMWGHSMGGEVTLRTLLATHRIRAASLWSSVGGDIWDQAYYYSRYDNPAAADSSSMEKSVVSALRRQIAALDRPFDPQSSDPYFHLDRLNTPLIMHHSADDQAAAFKWSLQLAKALYMRGKTYVFYPVEGSQHLFNEPDMEAAADRDDRFFRQYLTPSTSP